MTDDPLLGTAQGEALSQRPWFSIRQLILAFLVGLVVGVGGFWLTSMEPDQHSLGLCYPSMYAAFDPWTGLPHGATVTCPVSTLLSPALSGSTTQLATPPELAGRWAVPVPLGILLGAGLVLLVQMRTNSRRRRSG